MTTVEASIGELRLRVRAPPDAMPSAPDVERFARRVLEAVAEQVEVRWPGRVVLIRELAMSWRIPSSGIEEDDEAQAIAGEIVESFAGSLEPQPQEPDVAGLFAAFRDEAAYLAAYLDALGSPRGAAQWYFTAAASKAPGAWSDGVVLAALGQLWRGGRLPTVIGALPAAWVEHAATAAGAHRLATGGEGVAMPPAAMIAAARKLPSSLGEPGACLCLSVAAAALLPRASLAERAAVVRAVLPLCLPPRRTSPAEPGSVGSAEPTTSVVADQFATAWGGAVYLLTAAMEVSLGEILWRACLPEGAVFSAALAVLLGPEAASDPLTSLLGAAGGDTIEPSEAQQEEVSLSSSAGSCPRGSRVTRSCPVRLGLRHRGGDRLLVACIDAGAYPCFAWPAGNTSQLGRGLAAFLDRWPCHLRKPEASPGLAALDPRGRTLLTLDGQLPTRCRSRTRRAVPGRAPDPGCGLAGDRLVRPAGTDRR